MTAAQTTELATIETYDAAKIFLETAGAGLVGRKVLVTGYPPNLRVVTASKAGEAEVTVMNAACSTTAAIFKVSALHFFEPGNAHCFAAAMRALCGVAFEKKCTVIEFANMGLPYVKGLLPYGAVPLTVPPTLDAAIKTNMELTKVNQHLSIDEYTRLSFIHRRSLRYPHMAWLDLFMTDFSGPTEDPQKVAGDKSENFRRRMGIPETMTVIIALNQAAQFIMQGVGGNLPKFEPIAIPDPKTTDPYYQAAGLPAYRRAPLFPGMDG